MTFFSIVIVLVATALMQWHGIQFWSSIVGSGTGWAWSVALEASALWLWATRGKLLLAILASALLLAGPLFHISGPVFSELQQAETKESARVAQIAIVKNTIATEQATLATVLRNSEDRLGWLTEIQSSKDRLTQTESELMALVAAPAELSPIKTTIVASVQALSLLMIWIVSVSAISRLANNAAPRSLPKVKAAIPSPAVQDQPQPAASFTDQVSTALCLAIETQGITQREWATENGIDRKYVSLICNHAQRLSAGKEVASKAMFLKVAKALGISQE